MKIANVLTDNGSQSTDRFTGKGKQPAGHHAFDRECALLYIEHRSIKPHRPQTSDMVERFNGRIGDVLATTRFRSREDLQTTLERPDPFVRKSNNQAGLDSSGLR